MPAQRRTQSERRDDTRSRIIDAAQQVFARDGVGASVGEIAREADCSTGAIYTHFTGKRELMLAVFDAGFPNWANSYAAALAESATPDLSIAAATGHWRRLLDENPAQTQLYIEFWMAAIRDPELREPFRQRQGEIVATFANLITTALAAQGSPAPPATTLASIITALGDGLALQYLAGTTPDADQNLLEAITLLLAGLTAMESRP